MVPLLPDPTVESKGPVKVRESEVDALVNLIIGICLEVRESSILREKRILLAMSMYMEVRTHRHVQIS